MKDALHYGYAFAYLTLWLTLWLCLCLPSSPILVQALIPPTPLSYPLITCNPCPHHHLQAYLYPTHSSLQALLPPTPLSYHSSPPLCCSCQPLPPSI